MAQDRLSLLDYYTLLGLEQGAKADEIKRAFHTFARKFHPDRFAAATPDKRARAADIYRRGTEGYGVLSNPAKRKIYDAGLAKGHLRFDPSDQEAGGGGSKGRGTQRLVSPKARPFLVKAKAALSKDDYKTARLNLQIAATHDPNSEEIKKLADELKAKTEK